MPEGLRVIGIDPGSVRCGYGVLEYSRQGIVVVEYGVIEARRAAEALPERLRRIFERLQAVLERTQPEEAALETIFYARNAQSLAKLAHARGVALLALALRRIPVVEYSPRQIKQAVTGKGSATKEQVQYMVRALLSIGEEFRSYDVSDALAVALCHGFRRSQPGLERRPRSWKEFVRAFPERVLSPLPDSVRGRTR